LLLAAGWEGLRCGLRCEGLGRRGEFGDDEALADEDAGDEEGEHSAEGEQEHGEGEGEAQEVRPGAAGAGLG